MSYQTPAEFRITDEVALKALYGTPSQPALRKEVPFLHPAYHGFIEKAPFMAMATAGPGGLDVSPRGDPAGFVVIEDNQTLLIPDRRGNNRADSLRNLVHDPRIALIFLIPGIGETFRVNGRAAISVDPTLLARFRAQGKLPRSIIVVTVETAFFQCSKALVRSDLWNPDRRIPRTDLPSGGAILAALTEGEVGGAAYDAGYPQRLKETIY